MASAKPFNLAESRLAAEWYGDRVDLREIARRLGRTASSVRGHLIRKHPSLWRWESARRTDDGTADERRRCRLDDVRFDVYVTAIGKTRDELGKALAGRYSAAAIDRVLVEVTSAVMISGMYSPPILELGADGYYRRLNETERDVAVMGGYNRRVRVRRTVEAA